VEIDERLTDRLPSRSHGRRSLFVVQADDGIATGKPDGRDQPMLLLDMSNEVDVALDADLVQHRPEGVDTGFSGQESDIRRNSQVGKRV